MITDQMKPKILLLVSLVPLMSVGKNTFLQEVLELSGGKNITVLSESNYPVINREEVLKQDPDFILVPSDIIAETGKILEIYPEWEITNAFKKNNVYIINADLVQRPGPRIAESVSLIARLIHHNENKN
jgi:iron complex transport system substrate-binding protein